MPKCDNCDGGLEMSCCPACHGTGKRRWREVAADLRDRYNRVSEEASILRIQLHATEEKAERLDSVLTETQYNRDRLLADNHGLVATLRCLRNAVHFPAEHVMAVNLCDVTLARYDKEVPA